MLVLEFVVWEAVEGEGEEGVVYNASWELEIPSSLVEVYKASMVESILW